MKIFFFFISLFSVLSAPAHAHWSSPGFLELKQSSDRTFSVLWKVPLKSGRPLDIRPAFPASCTPQTPINAVTAGNAYIQRWIILCDSDLYGDSIAIDGLPLVQNDVLARVIRPDGSIQTERLTGNRPAFTLQSDPGSLAVIWTYIILGIEHILSGVDHLLFVLALLIIVRGFGRLVATITAFTLAHSVTLAAATLGWIRIPIQPVEAVIALSIVFLAVEIVRHRRANGNGEFSRLNLTYRWPWLVAFIFGLLHGFGFASALLELGLPQNDIPLALLFFNVGVELGQILFVIVCLGLMALVQRATRLSFTWAQTATAYFIGSVATYWTLDRVSGFWT